MSDENEIPGAGSSTGPSARRSTGAPSARPMPKPSPKAILCPYCGEVSKNVSRCTSCGGRFDHLSRQASQNSMGPWQIRDPHDPFRPGCSYETLKRLIAKGKVTESTVLRGPTTRQFWSPAKRTPAVANLFGICHGCQGPVNPADSACPRCGASFEPETDRQYLGLMPVRLLPGQAPAEMVAASTYQHAGPDAGERSREPRLDDRGADRGAPVTGGSQGAPVAAPAGVRFQHSMNGAAEVVPGDVLGGEIRLRSDGGGRAWLILAIVVTLLCLATAAGVLMLAPALGLELPRWASVLEPAEDEAPVEAAGADEPAETIQADGGEWDGLIRPGIDVGRERDEAASHRSAASSDTAPAEEQSGSDGEGAETAQAEDAVARVRALIAAGDAESLTLAREMLVDVPQPLRNVLAAAIDRVETLRRISGIL